MHLRHTLFGFFIFINTVGFGQGNIFARIWNSSKPFLISVTANKNVYKTNSTLSLVRVYDIDLTIPTTLDNYSYVPTLLFPHPKYRVVKVEGDNTYIQLLPFVNESGTTISPSTTAPTSGRPHRYYYKIAPGGGLLPNHKYKATERLLGMPMTLPVKFRKKNGNLRAKLEPSIGYAFGYRIRTNNNPFKDNYINIIPYGFAFNTDDYQSKDAPDADPKTNFSLTYWTSGLSYEVNGINFGLFVGKDRMFNDRKDWIYQKKLWLSVGLGFKFGGDK